MLLSDLGTFFRQQIASNYYFFCFITTIGRAYLGTHSQTGFFEGVLGWYFLLEQLMYILANIN